MSASDDIAEYMRFLDPRTTELDLSNRQLRKLPPEIAQLTELSQLALDNNQLSELPVEFAQLTNLSLLTLDHNRFSEVPPHLAPLGGLSHLSLHHNRLRKVPAWLGQLSNLSVLYLDNNQLDALPSSLGRLTRLSELALSHNQLRELPQSLCQLANLEKLWLSDNQLNSAPTWLSQLPLLSQLWLHNNQIHEIPSEFGQLTNLWQLRLSNNQLRVLPSSLGLLTKLTHLSLDDNPLREPFPKLVAEGINNLLAYLRGLSTPQTLYEAKLLIVGEGNVGKSCLVAAMQDKDFVENRPQTHGIEIEIGDLALHHSSVPDPIQIHAWDFGGQDVYHITHQFFFCDRALFLVVWHPREGTQEYAVNEWIRRIHLRVGNAARVLVVSTFCDTDQSPPSLDEPELRRQFGPVYVAAYAVDNRTGTGIEALKTGIAEQVANLPHMGECIGRHWLGARNRIRQTNEACINYDQFRTICAEEHLDSAETDALARLLHTLGDIVYFADDPGLEDLVVLKPEWLSKAISFVLEDKPTFDAHGVLKHTRLREIWYDHGIENRNKYAPRYHPYFLRMMEKFDICYRIDDEQSLVAQRVRYKRPRLSWHLDVPPSDDEHTLVLIYQLSDNPLGLIEWIIVRTHRFNIGAHWRRGVYLDNGHHGRALIEMIGNELHLIVRAIWPNYFLVLLQDTVNHILLRWPGLEFSHRVPCPNLDERGRPCAQRFPLLGLQKLARRRWSKIPCPECQNDVDIGLAIAGIPTGTEKSVLHEAVREELGSVMELLKRNLEAGAKDASEQAQMLRSIMRRLDTETRATPRLFTLHSELLGMLNPKNIGKEGFFLTLWCEFPDQQHPVCGWENMGAAESDEGEYHFKKDSKWFVKFSPVLSVAAGLLRLIPDTAGVKLSLNGRTFNDTNTAAQHMAKLAEATHRVETGSPGRWRGLLGSDLRQAQALLVELDRSQRWGGLRRVPTPEGDYLWLCPKHAEVFQPGRPDLNQRDP